MSEVSKVAEQLQIWADSGSRPDEWLLKEWAQRLRIVSAPSETPRFPHVESEPKSWRLIPEEPTHAMLDALENGAGATGAFRDMLSAAPTPPAGTTLSATPFKPVGLFWQTSDRRWHFSPGSTKRGDIHDNGRPIHIAYLGEEAARE